MKLLWKLAWRNVFRNRRRTLLSVLVISIGVASLIFMDGFMIGMSETMVRTATSSFVGHGQVHVPTHKTDPAVENTLKDVATLTQTLEQDPNITNVAPRIKSFAMIASSSNTHSILLYGIEATREEPITKIDDNIRKGEFLGSNENGILIGHRLAEKLEVDLGDRIVVTLAQAHTGDLSQELFRVSGIFTFNSRYMDLGIAFVSFGKAQSMLALNDQAHEFALRFQSLDADANQLRAPYKDKDILLERWDELMPTLKSMLEMSDVSMLILGGILFAIILVGVINTLFMSIYERLFEFGVLKAIGTRPRQLAALILLEATSLGILGALAGILLGFGLSYWISVAGIDFGNLDYAEVTLSEPIFTQLRWQQFVTIPLIVIGLTTLSGLYPAIYAARLIPSKAMRKSL